MDFLGHSLLSMNTLSFNILPSDESNDHEVRILIDGSDILGKYYLGIDPHEFFGQHNLLTTGLLLIGRCSCGVIGCDDYSVYVTVFADKVTWANKNGLKLEFDKSVYEKAISSAKTDFSWESMERRVERLTNDILKDSMTGDGYKFDWSSTRIREKVIRISYSKEGLQKIFEYTWDGQTVESAIREANNFIAQSQLNSPNNQ